MHNRHERWAECTKGDELKNTRLKDIAETTGVTIKTVSRALHNHPDVNAVTRQRILETAEKLNYFRNLVAAGLRKKQTLTIGYVIPDLVNEFFGELGITIERFLRARNYGMIISFSEGSPQNEVTALELLLTKRVDGIVLATVGETEGFIKRSIVKRGIPLVVIDNDLNGVVSDVVLHDDLHGARLLTEHLIQHGHQAIACVTGPARESSSVRRVDGYRQALAGASCRVPPTFLRSTDWSVAGGYAETLDLFDGVGQKPTAIFYANSVMALGGYRALHELELKVPSDVAVVSFDNLESIQALNPPLTTLSGTEPAFGETAASLLLGRIEGTRNGERERILLRSTLIPRQSCGCEDGSPT